MTSELWTAGPTREATEDVRAAVRAAVLDYFEGWFNADADRMRRALHPALAKRSRAQDPGRTPAVSSLTADQMIAWTAEGAGRHRAGPLEIRIDEISGGIAAVTVHSESYVEYLHLVATPDGWQIVNALWRYADGHGPVA
ncbi:MAG TPA: nuclear transport factor 2 family protein [Candidatus Limnocylindrales bacterium]|nr:nuclear transport factor 2 family protein [Candidatus Limnocylindrales bacterium]